MSNSILRTIDRYGSCEISDGTLRPQDTIPAMLDALLELAPAAYEQVVSPGCGFSQYPSYARDDHGCEWWQSEAADDLYATLDGTLNEHAPEGFYFGAHEGDGACLGFWPVTTPYYTHDEWDERIIEAERDSLCERDSDEIQRADHQYDLEKDDRLTGDRE